MQGLFFMHLHLLIIQFHGFSIFSHICHILRGRAGVARQAHNLEVTSSNLVPATKIKKNGRF